MSPAEPHGVDRALERYLLDSESIVTAVHQHWAKVAEPVASAVLGLVLTVWISSIAPATLSRVADVLWWVWFAVVARLVWRLLEWRHDWFVATDKRLLLTYGLITRKVAMMPLTKVTDLSYSRSPVGRVLGYGRFTLESAGQEQALHQIDWLPDPDRTYRAICTEIFGADVRRPARPGGAAPEAIELDEVDDGDSPVSGPVPPSDGETGWAVYRSPDRRQPAPEAHEDDTGPITPWRPDMTL